MIILFSLRFARTISEPLVSLTVASKQLAEGNMDFTIDKNLLKQGNEVGTLAISFYTMKDKLRSKIIQLDEARTSVEKNLKEVERMNTLMVGRELTMITMKKEIEQLKLHGEDLKKSK